MRVDLSLHMHGPIVQLSRNQLRPVEDQSDRFVNLTFFAHHEESLTVLRRLGNDPDENVAVRWTWALDGTLNVQEFTPGDRTPPPPGSADCSTDPGGV